MIQSKNKSLYYVSDSFYLEDKPYADIVIVPIGNRGLVMNSDEAYNFIKEINPKIVIPSHYETPKDNVNPLEFFVKFKDSKIIPKIMKYGESIKI